MKTRRGFSLMEIIVMGFIGLLVIAGTIQLLSAAWRTDTFTAGRLDSINAIYLTMDALRQDLFYADAGASDPARQTFAFRTRRPGQAQPEVIYYSWGGAGKALTRNGKALGFAKPTKVGLPVIEDTAVLTLDVPTSEVAPGGKPAHETQMSLPLVVPDAYWRERLSFWAERP